MALKKKRRKRQTWFAASKKTTKAKTKRHKAEKKRKPRKVPRDANTKGALNEEKVRKIKIGLKLIKKRPELGLTQQKIADKMGVSQALISQIANGHAWQDVKI